MPFFSSATEDTYLILLPDGRSLQTTRKLHQVIILLDGSRNIDEIAENLSNLWKHTIQPEEVQDWIDRYIAPHDLLVPDPSQSAAVGSASTGSSSTKGIMLVPARAALPVSRRLQALVHPTCSLPLLWLSAGCHGLVYLGLHSETGPGFFSCLPSSVYLIAYLLVFVSVLFHEFGHLSACTYFDCPHGEIRIGLYLIFPVFYANVSPSWRLNRKARVVVDLAGMYFQLLMTIPIALLFQLTGEPLWLLLFLELDAMILFSLNPFLRFDGYWLCSDLLGVPNLRSRSRLLIKSLCDRLLRRAPVPEAPLLKIRTGARIGLALYAVGSYVFGGLVLVLLCRFLPARIQALPAEVRRLVDDAAGDWARGDVSGVVVRLLQLLFLCALLFGAGRMLAQVLPALARAGGTLLAKLCRLVGKSTR